MRWAVHAISRRVFFVAPWLATNNLVEYARRMSVSVAALAVSLAMTVAIAVMVSSFRETVIYWVGQTLVADLYIGPAARRGGSSPGIVPAEVEAIVRAHPRVTAVDTFRVIDIPYQHARIFVGAGNFEALLVAQPAAVQGASARRSTPCARRSARTPRSCPKRSLCAIARTSAIT